MTRNLLPPSIVIATVLAGCTSYVPWADAQTFVPGESFSDDFEDGSIFDTEPIRWRRGTFDAERINIEEIDGNTSVEIVNTRQASVIAPADDSGTSYQSYENHSIRSQIRVTRISDEWTTAGFIARSLSPNVYLGYVNTNGILGIWQSGLNTVARIEEFPLNPGDEDVVLQMDLIGENIFLTAWSPDETKPSMPQLVYYDDTYATGTTGMYAGGNGELGSAAFRWVENEILPEYRSPDFDLDGAIGQADIDILASALTAGIDTPMFDLNRDEHVNEADVNFWLSTAAAQSGWQNPYQRGDANLDGSVDVNDLNTIALNWRMPDEVWRGGDFNFDGTTDVGDLNILALNWNSLINPRLVGVNAVGQHTLTLATPTPVPEPAGFAPLLWRWR